MSPWWIVLVLLIIGIIIIVTYLAMAKKDEKKEKLWYCTEGDCEIIRDSIQSEKCMKKCRDAREKFERNRHVKFASNRLEIDEKGEKTIGNT